VVLAPCEQGGTLSECAERFGFQKPLHIDRAEIDGLDGVGQRFGIDGARRSENRPARIAAKQDGCIEIAAKARGFVGRKPRIEAVCVKLQA